MKSKLFSIAFIATIFAISLNSQTVMSLSDDMEIASNSDIKIEEGDYELSDDGQAGIIRIINKENITIDGEGVSVNGGDFGGYFIYIENSENIVIRNFESVKGFYYATKASQSEALFIIDNNFSYNKKETVGWIYIWTGVDEALGGGVLLDHCTTFGVYSNTMTQQNDGLAMYHCRYGAIHHNTFNWNCGFGIRMNYTHNCRVEYNDCSHVNRETDPSDCAAILLIVSNNNVVEHNNLTYSGDGIFLGQYEHHETPNNNYFAYNDCSYSPHNAIEATFAGGNVFKYNKCNFSHYGLWLGYSFNTLVEGNEIIGNFNSGIAVDRGYNNTFTDNVIKSNPYGFELWKGGVIDPYGYQLSRDYQIHNNVIEGNTWGIHARNTEHLVAKDNQFIHNKVDMYFEGESHNDTISENTFRNPTEYFIQNMSPDYINAVNNSFIPGDRELILRKMRGSVGWYPFNVAAVDMMYNLPCDMAEPPAEWSTYADPGFGNRIDEVLEWDYDDKKVGDASIKFKTGRGWDIGVNYRPGGDSIAMWNLTEDDVLSVWIKTKKNPNYGFQYFHVRIGNYDQGYYKYTAPASYLNNAHNRWRHYTIPLKGNSNWVRETVGSMDPSEIHYVEVHADTWDHGYTIWLDGLQFGDCTPSGIDGVKVPEPSLSYAYPNPFIGGTAIEYHLEKSQQVQLRVFSNDGRQVAILFHGFQEVGPQRIEFNAKGLPPGLYYYQLNRGGVVETRKIVKM